MTQPARPEKARHQLPASTCIIGGKQFGGLNCTPESTAMGISKTTLEKQNPSGCDIRRGTHDTTGGTMLSQCALVASRDYGVQVELHVGNNVAKFSSLAIQIQAGRGMVLQGSTGALLGTPFQSTSGRVNHAVWLNEGRGWHDDIPDECLVYDPAADGRKRSYHVDDAPSWWPWSLVKKFAGALQPWGEGDSRTLAGTRPGTAYCGYFGDTEPHVHLAHGGAKTKPFPDRTRIKAPAGRLVRVHSIPASSDATVVARMGDGELYTAFQVTKTGESFKGSRIWYGGHNGDRWVHESRLTHEGGGT